MGIVTLKGLKFHAYHGVYPNEKKEGNTFIVDIEIETDLSKAAKSDDLNDTIDYALVFESVKSEMKIPSNLLEHIVDRINQAISKLITDSRIKTTVYKMNPPLEGNCEYSAVTLELNVN